MVQVELKLNQNHFIITQKPGVPHETLGATIVLLYLHIALGLVIIGLASYNFNGVRLTAVPGQ